MKAIELRIVFEDDDGKTDILTLRGADAEFWFGTHAQERLEADLLPGTLPAGEFRRCVLRKVTEVEGAYVPQGGGRGAWETASAIVETPPTMNSAVVDFERVLVPETMQDCTTTGKTATYRFRFDVTAVRVPEVKP